MVEPVAYIHSARSGHTADVYILRPPQNVVPKVRPNISQLRADNGLIGAVLHDPGLLYIGDEVVAGEDTSVILEFFIGGRIYLANGGSARIVGERNSVATGFSKAKNIKELGMTLAWHVAAWGVGALGRAVSAGGIYMKGGLEIYKTVPKVNLHLVQFYSGEAPNVAMWVSGLMHTKGLLGKPDRRGMSFGPTGIKG